MVGPPSGSRILKNSVMGSDQFRCAVGISNKGGLRNSKGVTRS